MYTRIVSVFLVSVALFFPGCTMNFKEYEQIVSGTTTSLAMGKVRIENEKIADEVSVTGTDSALVNATITVSRLSRYQDSPEGLSVRFYPGGTIDLAGSSDEGESMTVKGYSITADRTLPLEIRVVSANVKVSGMAKKVAVKNTSGNVSITGARDSVTVTATSGNVSVTSAKKITVDNTSGNITVTTSQGADVENISGNSSIYLVKDSTITFAGISVTSTSGNIKVELPRQTKTNVSLSTNSGTISSPWYSGSGKYTASINGGGPELHLYNTSGNITVTQF